MQTTKNRPAAEANKIGETREVLLHEGEQVILRVHDGTSDAKAPHVAKFEHYRITAIRCGSIQIDRWANNGFAPGIAGWVKARTERVREYGDSRVRVG